MISIRQKILKREGYRIGRFDFTNAENREKQFYENIWISFILRNNEDFICLGFCKAKKLNKKRYITLHMIRDLKLISFEEWLKKI